MIDSTSHIIQFQMLQWDKDQAAEAFLSPCLVYQREGLEAIWSNSINISQQGTVRDVKKFQKSNKQNYNQIQKLKVKAGKNQAGNNMSI